MSKLMRKTLPASGFFSALRRVVMMTQADSCAARSLDVGLVDLY